MHFFLVCENPNPCQNRGTCLTLRSGPGYKCNCPKILEGQLEGLPLYVGRDCEIQLNIKTSTDTVPPPVSATSPVMGPPLDQLEQGDKEHYENTIALILVMFFLNRFMCVGKHRPYW